MTQTMAAMPNHLGKGQAYDRKKSDMAIFDRSIPVIQGDVLPDPYVGQMIKDAGEREHYNALIADLKEAFPLATILVKRERLDDDHVTIELRFPSNGLKMRPEVTKFLDSAEGRRKDYFLLVVS